MKQLFPEKQIQNWTVERALEARLIVKAFLKHLKMSEILNMKINADLITLSACNSGVVEPGEFNEGVSGLARSFFYAGSKSVIVTLWSIDDNATILFMKILYNKLNEGMPINKAMNFARNKMLESKFAYPGLWAPYVLNGEVNFNRR